VVCGMDLVLCVWHFTLAVPGIFWRLKRAFCPVHCTIMFYYEAPFRRLNPEGLGYEAERWGGMAVARTHFTTLYV
jgi:hypothetical protein